MLLLCSYEQTFIDFPEIDDFFGFTETDSTWISTSARSALMYQISYCEVLFDLSLKNLTKISLTAAIEQNSKRKALSFETCWPSLMQP